MRAQCLARKCVWGPQSLGTRIQEADEGRGLTEEILGLDGLVELQLQLFSVVFTGVAKRFAQRLPSQNAGYLRGACAKEEEIKFLERRSATLKLRDIDCTARLRAAVNTEADQFYKWLRRNNLVGGLNA
jgi:hypothetical protein